VSKDGIHWDARRDMDWGQPHWHPEPPLFGFWNAKEKRHFMTVRPGWGDRRVCIQSTGGFKTWSGPRPLFQPEVQDGLVEFYGMPVFRYGEASVGLLWVFHCETNASAPPTGYNRFVGSLDTQLAYSCDGEHLQLGAHQPLIPLNAPGEIGGGAPETSCMVETETELRSCSEATAAQHGSGPKKGEANRPPGGIIIHTLRKDGLTHLRSLGGWGRFTSKPLTLFEPRLEINLDAPQGEAQFQLTDVKGRPLDCFTFENCEPIAKVDALRHPVRWRGQSLGAVVNKAVRLESRLRNGNLHTIRGRFHFLDAEDMQRLDAGKPIDPLWFDY
jgi:hypothetical protein